MNSDTYTIPACPVCRGVNGHRTPFCPKADLTDTPKAANYFDSYDNDHDAMMLLWQARDAAPPRIRRLIVSAIGHLRESAMKEIPYSATVPNKDSFGRYHGKRA